ncbi:hypothetical protein [Candidatus Williamhamiltonella defendens]|nr:hypothetical protein [Candidatus Hamiltonella defensa]
MKRFARFTLNHIIEAGDDISYCISDLEEAVEKNILILINSFTI